MRRFSKISTNSEQSQENKIIRDERSMKIPGLHFRENNSESDLIGMIFLDTAEFLRRKGSSCIYHGTLRGAFKLLCIFSSFFGILIFGQNPNFYPIFLKAPLIYPPIAWGVEFLRSFTVRRVSAIAAKTFKFPNNLLLLFAMQKRGKGGTGGCKIGTRLLAPIPIRPPQPIPATLTCLPTTGLGQSNMPGFRWDSHLLKNTTQQIFSYANSSRLYPC